MVFLFEKLKVAELVKRWPATSPKFVLPCHRSLASSTAILPRRAIRYTSTFSCRNFPLKVIQQLFPSSSSSCIFFYLFFCLSFYLSFNKVFWKAVPTQGRTYPVGLRTDLIRNSEWQYHLHRSGHCILSWAICLTLQSKMKLVLLTNVTRTLN